MSLLLAPRAAPAQSVDLAVGLGSVAATNIANGLLAGGRADAMLSPRFGLSGRTQRPSYPLHSYPTYLFDVGRGIPPSAPSPHCP